MTVIQYHKKRNKLWTKQKISFYIIYRVGYFESMVLCEVIALAENLNEITIRSLFCTYIWNHYKKNESERKEPGTYHMWRYSKLYEIGRYVLKKGYLIFGLYLNVTLNVLKPSMLINYHAIKYLKPSSSC